MDFPKLPKTKVSVNTQGEDPDSMVAWVTGTATHGASHGTIREALASLAGAAEAIRGTEVEVAAREKDGGIIEFTYLMPGRASLRTPQRPSKIFTRKSGSAGMRVAMWEARFHGAEAGAFGASEAEAVYRLVKSSEAVLGLEIECLTPGDEEDEVDPW